MIKARLFHSGNVKTKEETRFLTFSRFSWEQPWWIHSCNERMKNERQRSFRSRIEQQENSFSGLAKPERIVNRDILISTVHYPPFPRFEISSWNFFLFFFRSISSFRDFNLLSRKYLRRNWNRFLNRFLKVKMKRKKIMKFCYPNDKS